MRNKNRFYGKALTLFIFFSFLISSFPVKAQNVVTSDDLSGGFIVRSSAKVVQKKVVAKVSSNIKRIRTKVADTTKRIRKQTVIVAKTQPKRTKIIEVNPTAVAKVNTSTSKSREEGSKIFAGVGEYFLNRGEIDKAVEAFREAALMDEKNIAARQGFSEALTQKGNSLLEADDQVKARSYFLEAIKYNELNAGAFAGLGEVYDLTNENDKALDSYKKAIALDPSLTEIYGSLGILYYQKGEISEADSYITKALETSGDNAETQFFVGLVRFKQNRLPDAIKAFQTAVKLDPDYSEAYYYLGESYDQSGKNAEAIAAYKEAVRINPKYVEAWFDLGVAYNNGEKYEEAVTAYKEAIKLRNSFGEAYSNLGDVYRQLNKFDEAVSAYRLATTFIKDDAELYTNFGLSAARLALDPTRRSFWNSAIENFKKALEIKPDFINYSNVGWAYLNAAQSDFTFNLKTDAESKLQLAKPYLLEALKLNDKFAASYFNLGMVQSDLNETKDAIQSLKRANELRKDWIPALNELGIAYRNDNDFDNAAKQFKRVLEIDETFASAIFNLGETEFQRKNINEAKKAYQKLLKLGQNQLALRLDLISKGAVKK